MSLHVRACTLATGILWFIRGFYVWKVFNNFWLSASVFFCFFFFFISITPIIGPFLILFLQPFYAILFIISYARMTSPKPFTVNLSLFIQYFKSSGDKMSYLGLIHTLIASSWAWLVFYGIARTIENHSDGVTLYQFLLLFAKVSLFFGVSYFYQQVLVLTTCLLTNVNISPSHGHLLKAIFFACYAVFKNIKPLALQAMISIVLALMPVPLLVLISLVAQVSTRFLQLLYLIYCAYFFFPVYFGSLYEAYVTIFYHQEIELSDTNPTETEHKSDDNSSK